MWKVTFFRVLDPCALGVDWDIYFQPLRGAVHAPCPAAGVGVAGRGRPGKGEEEVSLMTDELCMCSHLPGLHWLPTEAS